MTGHSIYQIGHPLIDNGGDAKMKGFFLRKRGHEINCVGSPKTVPILKAKPNLLCETSLFVCYATYCIKYDD